MLKPLKDPPANSRTAATNSVRSYHEIIARLHALPRTNWQAEWVGEVSYYPVFAVSRSVAIDAPNILLTAGVHGDEPAGVEAALQWMEGEEWRPWRVNWLVLPCINPYGWSHDQRTTACGLDVNKHFLDSTSCPEADLVKRVLSDRRFRFALDLHEDSESDGYYLCEIKQQPPFLGARIPEALANLIPISENPRLDGRRAQGLGWVLRLAKRNAFKRRSRWPLAFHLAANCTEHFLCSETPTSIPLSQRVSAHLAVLQEALRFMTQPAEGAAH